MNNSINKNIPSNSPDSINNLGIENILMDGNHPKQSIFLEYFTVLKRRKWLIIISAFCIFLPIAVWTFYTTPIFEAEAAIIYEEPQDTMFALDIGQPFYNKSAILNLTQQLRSRSLSNQVARSLPDRIIELFGMNEIETDSTKRYRILAKVLRENLSVNGIRGSDILQIKLRAPDPVAAQFITNTFVDLIINSNLRKKRAEITNIHDFIEGQLDVVRQKLNTTEVDLQNFKEQNNMLSLSEASTNVLDRLTEAEVTYNQTKAEREALEQRKRVIERKKQEIAPSLTVGANAETQKLKRQLLEFEMEFSRKQLQGIEETEPELVALRNDINQIKEELVQKILNTSLRENLIDPLSQIRNLLQESITLDIELETYRARENGLKKIVDNYNQELRTLPKQEMELARLIRDKEVNDKIYSMLLEKREEARITKAGKIGDIRIIDRAEVPLKPVEPNKKKNLALGIILGLSFGIGIAFFLESLDTSLKTEEEVEKILNLPIVASIPQISTNGEFKLPTKSRHAKDFYTGKLLPQFTRVPHLYEAHQNLKLNFSFVNVTHNLKAIVMTSAGAGDGKTLNSINMAHIFARSGTKTLLIDCDLRRPMIHKILSLNQEPGLSQVLINEVMFENALQNVDTQNLDILTSGTLPPNPSDLLNTPQMGQLLNDIRSRYDLIIVDAPPVIAVTDSIVLGAKADGICLVVRANKTSRDAALRAKELLQKSETKIVGVILNDVNIKNVYGYYKDYYYYSDSAKQHA